MAEVLKPAIACCCPATVMEPLVVMAPIAARPSATEKAGRTPTGELTTPLDPEARPTGAPLLLMSKKSPLIPATALVPSSCFVSSATPATLPVLWTSIDSVGTERSAVRTFPLFQPPASSRWKFVRASPGATRWVATVARA